MSTSRPPIEGETGARVHFMKKRRAGINMRRIVLLCVIAIGPVIACINHRLPEDVLAFVAKRDACDHLRGELSEHPSENEISRVNRHCKGTDRALDALSKKYGGDPDVLKVLGSYETSIEVR